jgi:hypothetical protein
VRGAHEPAQWAHVAHARAASYPYQATYARWRQAKAQLATGARDEVVGAMRDAFSEPSRMGAAPLVADIETLARQARVRLAPAPAAPTPGDRGALGLTRREAEVLGAGRRGRDKPPDRQGAVHERQDGQRPRLAHPYQLGVATWG